MNDSNAQNGFDNHLELSTRSFYLQSKADYSWRKFKFSPVFKLSSLNQILNDFTTNHTDDKSDVLVEPFIGVSYKFSEKSGFLNSVGYSVDPFGEQHLFSNDVLISNRILTSNSPALALQKTFKASSFFFINDLYKQFQLNVGITYVKNMGNYFSNIFVEEQLTQINRFYLNENSQLLNYTFKIQKYIPSIESTIRIQTNVSSLHYKNVVNQSDLRNNRGTSIHSELFFKTAFDTKINFENVVFYNRDASSVDSGNQFTNDAINHIFKTIFKPNKQLLVIASTDYFIPNTKQQRQDFLFLDASAKYSPSKKPFSFSIIGKNLLNESNFKQFQVNDYSSSMYQSNLLARYVLINVSYSF